MTRYAIRPSVIVSLVVLIFFSIASRTIPEGVTHDRVVGVLLGMMLSAQAWSLVDVFSKRYIPKWTPIDKEMPISGSITLVTDGETISTADYSDKEGWLIYNQSNKKVVPDSVTHWLYPFEFKSTLPKWV